MYESQQLMATLIVKCIKQEKINNFNFNKHLFLLFRIKEGYNSWFNWGLCYSKIPLEKVDSLINLISSCGVERNFSKYNSILGDNRQNLSEESLRSLNMLYFNGSVV